MGQGSGRRVRRLLRLEAWRDRHGTRAHELGPRGITVNAVCPGTIRTELNEKEITEEARDLILASMVINRGWIEPDELANLYVFLASPAAKDITGRAYDYDCGQVMA
jgi:NAD(P)-dependent dehydrogenase (short-subunit alcohol dehydrogenase family)